MYRNIIIKYGEPYASYPTAVQSGSLTSHCDFISNTESFYNQNKIHDGKSIDTVNNSFKSIIKEILKKKLEEQ